MHALLLSLAMAAATQLPTDGRLDDVDAFMEKVLEQRDVNWNDFYNFFCTETAELRIDGSIEGAPMQGFRRQFLWFVRDGYLVRSPVSVDGVQVSAEDKKKSEDEWIERLEKRERERGPDRETFFGFKFEPGNYLFAGQTNFEGRDVVVVEYYPEELFEDDEEEQAKAKEENRKEVRIGGDGDEIEEALSKVFLVTLLIDPNEYQIVHMTLDNYGFEFLPMSWLVQLDTVEASLAMSKPFEAVWLPRDIAVYGKVTTAVGSLSVRYESTFSDYAKAETGATFRFPPRGLSEEKKKKQR